MKLITTIVGKEKIYAIREELVEKGITNLTVSSCQGYVHDSEYTEIFRGHRKEMSLEDKIRIEIACNDDMKDKAIEAIITAARTGASGDGKIWVTDIVEAYRISTEDKNEKAISRK